MRSDNLLRRRIVILAGLVCGQTRSKLFAEYLCGLGGGVPALMTGACFRVKDPDRPASDFGLSFKCAGGPVPEVTVFFGSEDVQKAWTHHYFKPNPCDYCDDVFAEVADVVFMDAWLDRYSKDPRGWNLVLIRRASLIEVFEQGRRDAEVHLEQTPVGDLVHSQRGGIVIKRAGLAERLRVAELLHLGAVPRKRAGPSRVSSYRLCQLLIERWVAHAARRAFLRQRARAGLRLFNRTMRPLLLLQKAMNYLPLLARRLRRRWRA
jgi:hypothetical protein